MAWNSYVNQSTSFSADVLYAVLKQMTSGSPSWTCLGSGDGTGGNYNGSGDLFTQCTELTGDPINYNFGNPTSWFRVEDPGSASEFIFQYITDDDPTYHRPQWLIQYSSSAGFIGGSPDAATPPTATDQITIPSDAEATYTRPLIVPASMHLAWCDTSINGSYPFWYYAYNSIYFLYDAIVANTETETLSDYSLFLNASSALDYNSGANLGSTSSLLKRFANMGGYDGVYSIPYMRDVTANLTPGALGTTPDGADDLIIPAAVRQVTNNFGLGQLYVMSYLSSSGGQGDTYSDGTDEYLVLDDVLWRGWPLGGPAPTFT